jgi:hypothetical protein
MSTLGIADEPKISMPLDRLRWTWEAEDAPVRVQIPLDLVARLRKEIEGDARVSASEIGGVLLGRPGKVQGSVEVVDYAWVESDEAPASQYLLDIAALEPLREARPDLLILGYFRTQLEGALNLRLDETEFVAERFRDPSSVMMLIRPSGEQFQAGFLTWKGNTFVPFSIQDFPFKAEALQSAASPIPVEIPDPVEIHEETAFEAAPAIVRVPVRSAPKSRRRGLAPIRLKVRIRIKTPTETKHYVRRAAVGLSGLAAAGALSGFAVMDLFPAPRISPPVVVAGAPLELQAELQDKGLEVRWNPDSGTVAKALEGQLALVQPDGRSEVIPLNGHQLNSGHMELPSGVDAVEVRLQVVDGGGRIARESFSGFQLGPEPEPMVDAPAIPVAAQEATPARTPVEAPKPASAGDDEASESQDFVGASTYPADRGRADGAQAEVVDGVIHKQNGRLTGTMFVHLNPGSEGDRGFTHRLQFAGDLRSGGTQVFPLKNVQGVKGTVEVAGNSPDQIEVRLQTGQDRGARKIVLTKK